MASAEGRFGRTGEVHLCWCPPEIIPIVVKQQVRQYIYAQDYLRTLQERNSARWCRRCARFRENELFDFALCQSGDDEFILSTSVRRFCRLFYYLASRSSRKPYRAKRWQIPENIRLVPQPPYSLESMPVEHLWNDLKKKYFHNHIFKSFDAVEATLCKALKELDAECERLRMTNFPQMRITFSTATWYQPLISKVFAVIFIQWNRAAECYPPYSLAFFRFKFCIFKRT